MTDRLPPLGLYLHYPWCLRKCPYCDFNSHACEGAAPDRAWADALLRDLEQELPLVWGRRVRTIFIGGGTPSLVAPEALDRLFSGLRARLDIAPDAEVTLEANPGASEAARFKEYHALGVNRLSIGVQSLDDDLLPRIGRIHDRRGAWRAIEAAHDAGFARINLDLMFGLPKQTPPGALKELEEALALEPHHLSYYQLTLEPHTAFGHTPPELPDEDLVWRMQEQGERRLAEAGFDHYEVSAYARPGQQCRHNLGYWRFGDYLGLGPGAHGKLTAPEPFTITRRWKQRAPEAYLREAHGPGVVAGEERVDGRDLPFEFMLNALRLTHGVEPELFEQHTGLPLEVIEAPLLRARERGLLDEDEEQIRPTERGRQFLNDLIELFLPESDT